MTPPRPLLFPPLLQAAGTADAPLEPLLPIDELPPGSHVRVTRGDLDVLLVHSEAGIAALEDRCPHMSAPFSAGALDGCLLRCPLHRGTFDLRDGEVVDFPTTGGLTADGESRAPWSPEGSEPRPAPSDAKALARSLTRVRRLRYFPLRISDGWVEVALPR
jgi:3-phenylpropionate/trans-cinnamate dioxygenase ferredoxin subunit